MRKKYLSYTRNLSRILLLLFCTTSYAVISTPINTGVESIFLSDALELKIRSNLDNECLGGDLEDIACIPKSTLMMNIDGVDIDLPDSLEEWEGFFVYFVQIGEKKYFKDLNGDGQVEFAVSAMLGERNPTQVVKIFSLGHNYISYFGRGEFHWEKGSHVFNIKRKY